MVEDREDMVVPFACLHACMLCMECVDPKSTTSCTYLYFFDSERVVCIFYLFLTFFYTGCNVWDGGREVETVHIGIVRVCGCG